MGLVTSFIAPLSTSYSQITSNTQRQGESSQVLCVERERDLWWLQALIKFKNYFYFEERDEQVEEFEKVKLSHELMMM